MLKPNYVGTKVFFDSANHFVTTLNNTIMDAVSSVNTSHTIYPHAYTSVINSDRDHHSWCTVDGSSSVNIGYKYACGLFLPDSSQDGKDNTLISLYGNVVYSCNIASNHLNNFFFLGRTASTSVTQSDALPSNAITNYIILPDASPTASGAGTVNQYRFNIQVDVAKIGFDTNAYPLCFGHCIENCSNSVTPVMYWMQITLGANSNLSNIPVFRPSGF